MHKVWEDDAHLAFLSIFPNIKGATVVIPKKHIPSYAFDMEDSDLSALVIAAKKVARLLDANLPGVGRTAMVFEGFGIDHVHAKLFPLHGTPKDDWRPINSTERKFFEKYEGYISSNDGPRADDDKLAKLAEQIRKMAEQ
jgi:diadenosine tetraphosphate (Ap4A) HIT family hydrolase